MTVPGSTETRDVAKNGDLVKIVSGINKDRTGYVLKIMTNDDDRCVVDLGQSEEFETGLDNVLPLDKPAPGTKKKVVRK